MLREERYSPLLNNYMIKHCCKFLLLISSQYAFSQESHLGAIFEYGKGHFKSQSGYYYYYDEKGQANKYAFSIYADYKPKKPIFNLNTSLTFSRFVWNDASYSFLKIPLGADFILGNNDFQLLFGASIFWQLLLLKTGNLNIGKTNRHQFGVTPDLGFCTRLFDNYYFFTRLQIDLMISSLIEIEQAHHASDYLFKFNDIGINLGVKIKLNNNNSGL